MKEIKNLYLMIRKLLYIMSSKQRKDSIFLLVIIFIGSLFELLGVTAIIPFITAMMSPEEMMRKAYLKKILEVFNIQDRISFCIFLGICIVVIYLIKNVYLTFSAYVQIKFRSGFQKELSVKMLSTYMRRPYTYFLDTNSGVIMRGVGSAVSGVFAILDNLSKLISEALTAILVGIFIIYTDMFMALGVLSLAALCFLGVTLGFKKKMSSVGQTEYKTVALKSAYSYQAIMGHKEIKVMRREGYFVKEYEKAAEAGRKADIAYNFIGVLPERIIESVCVGSLIAVVCIRLATGVSVESFIPKLAAFAVAAFRILPSISRMTGYINKLVYFKPSLEDAYTNMLEVYEYEKNCILQEHEEDIKNDLNFYNKKFNKIQVSNVKWKYDNAKEFVIENLTLEIRRGESIAFIGQSGAGKTTLADIILGLLQPKCGQIKIDDTDIFTIPKAWARMVGYVPQSVFLIDDSVRANVAFGLHENEIDDSMIWDALDRAQLKTFVENLPDGLETLVGERGVKFSGGQRQRVAIARALYYNPEILVLDEATAALDTETEMAVMEAIESLQGYKTLIIVAHRLSTIKNCNHIFEIKNGTAYERTFDEIETKEIK